MKHVIFCSFLFVFAGLVDAFSQNKPFVYDFLRNDASARASAMAGAFVTVSNDPAGLFYNPALLNTLDSTSRVSFTGFKHVLDINSGVLVGGTRIEGVGAVGAGITFNSYGSF